MIILNYLFGTVPLNEKFYKLNKKNFHNSRVLLPDLPQNIVELLEKFNSYIDSSFMSYVETAGNIFPKEKENLLPVSNIKFDTTKDSGAAFNLVSPFAVLPGTYLQCPF